MFVLLLYIIQGCFILQAISLYCLPSVGKLVLGWLGRRVRVVLPSCAVNKIRTTFPSATYAGFKYPSTSWVHNYNDNINIMIYIDFVRQDCSSCWLWVRGGVCWHTESTPIMSNSKGLFWSVILTAKRLWTLHHFYRGYSPTTDINYLPHKLVNVI